MSYKIYITTPFEKELKKLSKKYPSLKDDFSKLVSSLKTNPKQGTPLGKNCYKIRLAITSKGKGKSGGSRVISCIKVTVKNVFLIALYDKSEKDKLNDKELDLLLKKAGL